MANIFIFGKNNLWPSFILFSYSSLSEISVGKKKGRRKRKEKLVLGRSFSLFSPSLFFSPEPAQARPTYPFAASSLTRSEERRVGKECQVAV